LESLAAPAARQNVQNKPNLPVANRGRNCAGTLQGPVVQTKPIRPDRRVRKTNPIRADGPARKSDPIWPTRFCGIGILPMIRGRGRSMPPLWGDGQLCETNPISGPGGWGEARGTTAWGVVQTNPIGWSELWKTNPIRHPPHRDQRNRSCETKPIAPLGVSGEDAQPTKSPGPVAPNKPNLPIADRGSGTKLRRDAPRGQLHKQTQLAGANYAKRSQFATRGAGTGGTNVRNEANHRQDADATGVPHAPSGCSGEFACLGRRGRVALWLRDRMVPC
jgi:hypothetical protein